MYAETIDSKLSLIRSDLLGRGLSYEHLQDDILDHICCMLEEEMESGKDFESSYGELMSGIEENTLSSLQHQTLLLLDRKFQKMKKTTYVFGLAGSVMTIIGAIFKIMHWPGASVLMSLGFLLVVLVFLPLYFIMSYREMPEKPKLIFPIVGFLSLFLVFTGAVFKIMHWPGAGVVLRISVIVLLVGFLPLYIVQVFKKSATQKVNLAYIIMLLVGLSIVLILAKVNLSKESIDYYTDLSIENNEAQDALLSAIDEKVLILGDSLVSDKYVDLSEAREGLILMIEEMQNGMLEKRNQTGIPINEVSGRDIRNAGRDAFLDNGLAEEFLTAAREYRDILNVLVTDPIHKVQVKSYLKFMDKNWIDGWNPESYVYDPLIVNYYMFSEFARNILLCEYMALSEMSTQE